MDEILKALADHAGVSVDKARVALGAIVAFLRDDLPGELSDRLMRSIPDAKELASAFESNRSAGGEALMDAVAGMATRVLGEANGEGTKLVGMLHQAGLEPGQIESFLPKVLELIKPHLPAEVYDTILKLIPGASQAAGRA